MTKICYGIFLILWLSCIVYFVITSDWISLIGNILAFIVSFLCGVIYSKVKI